MRSPLGRRALHLKPSATLAVDARAKALIASGVDIVNLTAYVSSLPVGNKEVQRTAVR